MIKVLQTFRGYSGSLPVYYTNEQIVPTGLTDVTLISSLRVETEEGGELQGAVESWTMNGDLGLTGSTDGTLLSVGTGTKIFGPGPLSKQQSIFLNGSTRFQSPITASLQITGDVTLSFFVYPITSVSTDAAMVTVHGDASSDTEPNNFLYDLRVNQGNTLQGFFEEGAGVNVFTTPSPGSSIAAGKWSHVVYRRTAGTSSIFNSGRQVAEVDTGNPTGGTNARLHIGAFSNNSTFFTGYIARVKIFDRGLSDDEILQEKTAILGVVS